MQRRRLVATTLCAMTIALIFLFAAARGGLVQVGSASGASGRTGFNMDSITPGTFGSASTPGVLFIAGGGTFSPGGVHGSGIWDVSNVAGTVSFASGSWIAIKMLGFVSYGLFDQRDEGGNLTILVDVHFDGSGKVVVATLQVTCINGSPPPTAVEGDTLVGPGFSFLHPTPFPTAGLNDFVPNLEGFTSAVTPLAMATVRSSFGACNLGCC